MSFETHNFNIIVTSILQKFYSKKVCLINDIYLKQKLVKTFEKQLILSEFQNMKYFIFRLFSFQVKNKCV
jgi:hypothetical protein